MTSDARNQVIDALHASRMKPYLAAAYQNKKNALSLYRWHTDLTAAVQSVLGLTEVVLRNAMDKELQAWNNTQSNGTSSWLPNEPAAPLRSLSAGKRKEAQARAAKSQAARSDQHARHGAPVSHDDVLANITFGLWKELLPNHLPSAGNATENANRLRLWNEGLSKAFPHIPDDDGQITFWRVAHLHELRNRVSHMEPLLNVDVKDRTDNAFKLLQSINGAVANWVAGGSQVQAVLNRRPDV